MPKQHKIAMVTGVFPTVSETFVVNQIKSLLDFGQRVEVFCLKKRRELNRNTSYGFEKRVTEFQWQNLMPSNKALRFLKVLEILLKAFKRKLFFKIWLSLFSKGKAFNTHKFFKRYYQYYFEIEGYDVLHIHFGNNAMLLLEQIKYFKGKVLVTFHGFDAHKYDAVFYKPLKELSKVIYSVNTEYTRGKVIELGFKKDKIKILPVGLDTQFFNPTGKQKEDFKFNILFIGRLVEFKAPLLAIKIVHKVSKSFKDVVLHVVGSGPEEANCKNYVADNNLEQEVVFHGNKTQPEIKELMESMDVFLFPGIIDQEGRCENQGLVIQEAQAMQLPVLVSDVGGIKEGVLDGKSGYIIQNENIDAFVKKLLKIYKNKGLRDKLGNNGRQFVIENYENLILTKKLVKIYNDI